MSKEIKTSHFKTIEELLEHLKMWERDGDYEAYCRFFDYECAYEMAHYIDKLQKENENLNKKNKRYEKYLKNKDIEHEKVLEYIETEKERDYVSKDTIRDKIKELEEDIEVHSIYEENWNKIEVLKELLGE